MISTLLQLRCPGEWSFQPHCFGWYTFLTCVVTLVPPQWIGGFLLSLLREESKRKKNSLVIHKLTSSGLIEGISILGKV